MSGTSLDGVDFALCRIGEDLVDLEKLWTAPFPRALSRRLHALASNQGTAWELADCHHELGRFYARAAKECLGGEQVDLVGLHGQTVFHNPDASRAATLQIGESAWLAESLRVPVIANFRTADLSAGGQGAPLATLFHEAVFAERGKHVCVNNLGGISNVTSLDWRRGARPRVLAFDTGPANMLLDMAVRHASQGRRSCDKGGRLAARGTPCETLLRRWLKDPFLKAKPPKSTGRERFGEPFFKRILPELERLCPAPPDMLATFTEFTVRSIVANYADHLPSPIDTVVLTGGGAANAEIVRRLEASLQLRSPKLRVLTGDALGWPLQAIEPAAFALLAWRRWHGLPGNRPDTTGARHAVLCGHIAEAC
jgi:anhydro-N-acetylmuramic acid kinase